MAQLNDTMVQGDLRVTGTTYSDLAAKLIMSGASQADLNEVYSKISINSVCNQYLKTEIASSGSSADTWTLTPITAYNKNSNVLYFNGWYGNNHYEATYNSTLGAWSTSVTPFLSKDESDSLYISKTSSLVGNVADDREPVLTTSRYFTWVNQTPIGEPTTYRVLMGIGKLDSTQNDVQYFEGFGLLFNESKNSILKYKNSYVIYYNSTWGDVSQLTYTISNARFLGRAYEAETAYAAGGSLETTLTSAATSVKCTINTSSNEYRSLLFMSSANPTSAANQSLQYTSWLKYNPNTDKLNIGSSTTSGTRTEIGAGSITLYKTVSGSTTSFTLEPDTIVPTNHASAETTYGIGSTSNHGHVKLSTNIPQQSGDDPSGATAMSWKSWNFSNNSTTAVKNWNSLTQTSIVQITGSPAPDDDTTSPESGRVNAIAVSSDGQYSQLSMGLALNYRYKKANQTSWEAWEHVVTSGNIKKLVVSNSVGTENDVIYFT